MTEATDLREPLCSSFFICISSCFIYLHICVLAPMHHSTHVEVMWVLRVDELRLSCLATASLSISLAPGLSFKASTVYWLSASKLLGLTNFVMVHTRKQMELECLGSKAHGCSIGPPAMWERRQEPRPSRHLCIGCFPFLLLVPTTPLPMCSQGVHYVKAF